MADSLLLTKWKLVVLDNFTKSEPVVSEQFSLLSFIVNDLRVNEKHITVKSVNEVAIWLRLSALY